MQIGLGIASGGWSGCNAVVGKLGTNSTSHSIAVVLAGGGVLLLAQPAGGGVEVAGRSVVLRWGRVVIAGKISTLEIKLLGV